MWDFRMNPSADKAKGGSSRLMTGVQPTAALTVDRLGSNAMSGLTSQEARARLALDGTNEIPPKRSHPLLTFAQKFWGLSAWMIELIVILSFALGKYTDFAVALGLLVINAVLSLLGLLAFAWGRFDFGAHNGQLQTFTYQTLLFFALFSIVSIRERRAFWASRPSLVLSLSLLADACLGIIIGLVGLAELKPIPIGETALILGYALICSLGLNDILKQLMISRLTRRMRR